MTMARKKGSMKGHTIGGGHKRPTKSGAGMTAKGGAKYRREKPGSKLKFMRSTWGVGYSSPIMGGVC